MKDNIQKPTQNNSMHSKFMHEIKKTTSLIDQYPFEDKVSYGYFLNQQYFLICHTTRLITLAASLVDTDKPEEFNWWTEHLHEEMNHDHLILNDMKAINYTYSKECEPIIRGLYLALFEDIRRNGRDTILGYALMLEGISQERCSIVSERVKATYGTGHSYLDVHAIADEAHFPEGMERLESFSIEQKQNVLNNLYMSAEMYRNFLSKINR